MPTQNCQDDVIEVRSKRQQGWFWVENDFVDRLASRVGHDAFAVYICLCRFSDVKTQECYPSISTLQNLLKMGRSKVLEAISSLEENQVIAVDRSRSPGGVNHYVLLDLKSDQFQGETTTSSKAVLPQFQGGTGVVPGRNPKEDFLKADSSKVDSPKPLRGKKESTKKLKTAKTKEEKQLEKLIDLKQDLPGWMIKVPNDAPFLKKWRLTGSPGGKGNRYQGPTASIMERLLDQEKTFGPEFFRMCWLKFLKKCPDYERFPFRTFINGFVEQEYEKSHETENLKTRDLLAEEIDRQMQAEKDGMMPCVPA